MRAVGESYLVVFSVFIKRYRKIEGISDLQRIDSGIFFKILALPAKGNKNKEKADDEKFVYKFFYCHWNNKVFEIYSITD